MDEVVAKFRRLDTYSGKNSDKMYNLSPKSIKSGRTRLTNPSTTENFDEYLGKIEKV